MKSYFIFKKQLKAFSAPFPVKKDIWKDKIAILGLQYSAVCNYFIPHHLLILNSSKPR